MTQAPVRFGVIAPTSMVARLAVVPAIVASEKCELVAAASLSAGEGDRARLAPEGTNWHADYESLLRDPTVEAVYIPLPNSMHREWTERAATAAKHVLCEKPLAATSADARAMAEAVRAARVLLMEAYMTPFHPRSAEAVRLAAAGNAGPLGDLQAIDATFRFPLEDPLNHRWRPEMGGGALLDVGIYCLAPMFSATRTSPSAATVTLASVNIGGGGVDATLSATLRLGEQGPVARFDVSFEKEEHQSITFEGSAGVMHVDTSFTPGREDEHLVVELRDGSKEEIWTGGEDPYRGMVDHFADCVRGRTQMSRTPADSIELLELMERIRAVAMAGR